jgi:hypothetical protein
MSGVHPEDIFSLSANHGDIEGSGEFRLGGLAYSTSYGLGFVFFSGIQLFWNPQIILFEVNEVFGQVAKIMIEWITAMLHDLLTKGRYPWKNESR